MTPKSTLIVAGVAVIGLWYLKGRTVEAIKDVGQAVNPVNPENIFNQGFEAVYGAVTDGKGTPGTDLADWSDELDRKYYKYTPLGWWDALTGGNDE